VGDQDTDRLGPELSDLAAAYGVATEYWDWRGNHVEVARATIVAVLRALDVDATTPAAVRRELTAAAQQKWRHLLPPCVATREDVATRFAVHVPHGAPVEVWVELEDGTRRGDLVQVHHLVAPQWVDDTLIGEATFSLPPDLPTGYHRLRARSAEREADVPLLVTPARIPLPDSVASHRSWGYAVQLYSMRSSRSWGLGDLADLAELVSWSGRELGAGFVLPNPLFASDPTVPVEPSPYLPTSRQFVSPLYLRVEDVPEYGYLSVAERERIEALAQPCKEKNTSADLLDRDSVWAAKLAALEALQEVPLAPGRASEYRAYLSREGSALTDFATWCVLAEQHGDDWHEWPEALRSPSSAEVSEARRAAADRVELYRRAQWWLDEQLAAVQSRARDAGMGLGVVHDLPVGVHPDGADAWALSDVLARDIGVGAPADEFNQQGQDWSLPPWRPDRLAATGYAAWRDLASRVFRHAGGLRVDHVIGMFRLWWVPAGMRADQGTYVRYDHEALVGILALEAARAGAVLVGEDLGTVEPWVRDVLRERGILGTSVLWFERQSDGSPLPPELWRELCLATVTVHDLPPSAAYLDGAHVRLRDSLGLLTRSVEEELAAFHAEQSLWQSVLTARGLLRPGAGEQEVIEALHRYVALTPSRLVGVALTDAVGDRRTQNQPGTNKEYANWQQPLCGPDGAPVLLDDLPTLDRLRALAATLATLR
jgi:4-alpha-glucanotransferase